jgi:hypothetical protein
MTTYDFTSELWLHTNMPGAWHFLTIPADAADEIKARSQGERRGFGSVRVQATIGQTTWATSIFPDTKSSSYLLRSRRLSAAKRASRQEMRSRR